MESNNCDHLLDKLKDVMFEYLKCLTEEIIDELNNTLQDEKLSSNKHKLLSSVRKDIFEDLRLELHKLVEVETQNNIRLNKMSAEEEIGAHESLRISNDKEVDINEFRPGQNRFYFGAPEKDLTFPEIRKTTDIGNKSVFEFKLINEGEAEITIINDEKTHRKMIYAYDTYLKGTIKSSNTFKNDFTSIVVDQPGSAELKNGEWVIKDKIQVTFK